MEVPNETGKTFTGILNGVEYLNFPISDLPPEIKPLAELEAAKQDKLSEIEAAYNDAISADIDFNGHTFQADQKSQDILTKVIASAPAGFTTDWLDATNTPVSMTLDDLKGLAGAILQRGQQAFLHRVDLKNQVNAATTVTDVEAIIW